MSRLKHVQVSRLEKRSKEKCWKKTEWKLPLAPAAHGAHGWRSSSRGGGHKPIGAGRRMGRRRKLPWTATEIQWWLLQMFVLIWNCHSCVFLKLFQLKNGVVIVNYRNIVAFTWQAFGFANAKALHQALIFALRSGGIQSFILAFPHGLFSLIWTSGRAYLLIVKFGLSACISILASRSTSGCTSEWILC